MNECIMFKCLQILCVKYHDAETLNTLLVCMTSLTPIRRHAARWCCTDKIMRLIITTASNARRINHGQQSSSLS